MKISVITVNYNNADKLDRTIRSVAGQGRKDYEYIVVDGNSQDDSAAIVERHREAIDTVVMEEDTGPFQAMNKGAAIATGEYLLFLNSGDVLAGNDSLIKAEAFLAGKDIYYSDALFWRRGREWVQPFPDSVDLDYLLLHALNHQNMLIKRTFLSGRGGYDESYGMISDWGFMVKAFYEEAPSIEHMPTIIAKYYLDGITSSDANQAKLFSEKRRFLEAIDPVRGASLYKYTELCDSDYYRVMTRFRDKTLFAKLVRLPLQALKVLARMGL